MFYIHVLWNGDTKFTPYGDCPYDKLEEAFKEADKIPTRHTNEVKEVGVFNEDGQRVKRKAKIKKRLR